MAVLLGAAEREHGAVVALEVRLDLHPVHVADAHGRLYSVDRFATTYAFAPLEALR